MLIAERTLRRSHERQRSRSHQQIHRFLLSQRWITVHQASGRARSCLDGRREEGKQVKGPGLEPQQDMTDYAIRTMVRTIESITGRTTVFEETEVFPPMSIQ